MSIYQFIEHAAAMRRGGICVINCPQSFGHIKARHHRNEKLNRAYGAICRFRIKHPDSTRTPKARQRSLSLRAARIEVSL
jgi:hypothetical protein